VGSAAGAATAAIDGGLVDGTTYYYVVRAYDGTFESPNASEASAAPRSNAVEFLHQETSAVDSLYRRLKQDAPGTNGDPVSISASYQTINLANEVPGSFFIEAFETQAGDPGGAVTIPAGSVFRVTLYMDKTTDAAGAGVIYPRASVSKVDASAVRTTVCVADDATNPGLTPLTATTTALTFNCLNAAPVTLAVTDRLWLWTGVRLTTSPTINVSARLFVEGTTGSPPAYQSQLTIPWHETTAPTAPNGLIAADHPNDDGGAVDLSWTGVADPDVAGYVLYRSTTSGGPYTRVNAYPSLVASYVDRSVSAGTFYYYVVRSYDTSGNESGNSNQASVTPLDTLPPPAVIDFAAGDGADSGATLSWTNPVDPTLGEVLVARKTGGYPTGHADPLAAVVYDSTTPVSGGSVSFFDTGLTNGTTYYYAVYTRDAAGNWNDATTPAGNADTAVPSSLAPASPTNVTASDRPADQGGAVVLSWTPSTAPGIVEQRVFRSTTSGGPYTLVVALAGNSATSYTDVGLVNGVMYFYVVRAWNGTQESGDSNQAAAVPLDNVAAAAPSALTVVDTPADSGTALNLTWTVSVSSDVTQQRVYRGTVSSGPYSLVAVIADNTTSAYTNTGLTTGTSYYYVVRAFDGTQESAPSNEADAVPIDDRAPTNVTAVDAPADEGGSIDLTWTPSSMPGLTEQRVYRSTTTGGPYDLISTVPDNTTASYADSGLTNGTTYYYVLRSFDGTEESANSAEASAAPLDNLAPAPPTGLAAADRPADQGGALVMTWSPSTAADVTQQRVYRSATSGGPYTLVLAISDNTTASYTDTGLTNGTPYYYVVTAFDGTQESPNSTQVSAVPLSNATFHMHNEPSALSGARQLLQAGPDAAPTAIQSGQLVGGVNAIADFETQLGDPNGATTLAAGSTVSFTLYLQETETSGTMMPYAAVYQNTAAAGNLICSGTGGTSITTTMTAYTFTCAVPAGGVSFVPTDRLYMAVGVNATSVPTATNRVNVGVEGTLNGARDSRVVVPWP
ncbi:MAG TPA: fibronectin type III domain-containing protein, partial [Nitrospiria bacterium]|nr:fibronectin type III domain-containing protein [Nitrospiria bacterium]